MCSILFDFLQTHVDLLSHTRFRIGSVCVCVRESILYAYRTHIICLSPSTATKTSNSPVCMLFVIIVNGIYFYELTGFNWFVVARLQCHLMKYIYLVINFSLTRIWLNSIFPCHFQTEEMRCMSHIYFMCVCVCLLYLAIVNWWENLF